jgi:hypothetical protein
MPTNGLVVMTPTSIASTGTGNSSSINADGSVDFASCATLSLNGVFTSSYDNYMVVMRSVASNNAETGNIRLRASGSDNSTASSYTRQYIAANGTSVTANRTSGSDAFIYNSDDTQRSGLILYLFGPYLVQPTAGRTTPVSGFDNAYLLDAAFTHNQSTSYDGFSLYPATGSFSGLLTVFGFNQ